LKQIAIASFEQSFVSISQSTASHDWSVPKHFWIRNTLWMNWQGTTIDRFFKETVFCFKDFPLWKQIVDHMFCRAGLVRFYITLQRKNCAFGNFLQKKRGQTLFCQSRSLKLRAPQNGRILLGLWRCLTVNF